MSQLQGSNVADSLSYGVDYHRSQSSENLEALHMKFIQYMSNETSSSFIPDTRTSKSRA